GERARAGDRPAAERLPFVDLERDRLRAPAVDRVRADGRRRPLLELRRDAARDLARAERRRRGGRGGRPRSGRRSGGTGCGLYRKARADRIADREGELMDFKYTPEEEKFRREVRSW